MTTTTISPFVVSNIDEVELTDDKGGKRKLWRKQILPSGTRKYNGQTLDFSKINPSVVKAFDEGARDAVPFVLPLSDNQHPKRGEEAKLLEGDLEKLELSNEGELYGYFKLSDEAERIVRNSNNKFGVSGAIEVDYHREDVGKKWDYVLSHVCGTTGPHIKGMKPWETVELSEDSGEITLDLSTEVIDEETKEEETGDDLVAVNISQEQLNKLLKLAADVDSLGVTDSGKTGDEGTGGNEPTQLSEEATKRIELAENAAREAFRLAEKAQMDAAKKTWEARERELALAGVPPVMLTEAAKVLALHKPVTIELTEDGGNKSTVNATEVIEALLEAAKGTIKLSEEKGHSVTDAGSSQGDKDFDDFFEKFSADFGM
jgi:hypothetical protein